MSIGHCMGRTILESGHADHLVVVVPETRLGEALKYASVSVPQGSACGGNTWITPDGRRVTVTSINASPTSKGFSLALCGWGDRDHAPQWEKLTQWKDAAKAV